MKVRLLSVPRDILLEISKLLTFKDILNLSFVCSALYSAIQKDRNLWVSFLTRELTYGSYRLPKNHLPISDASVEVLRALLKHAHVLKRAYQHPNMDRTAITARTAACVTFVKLVRARWFLVASSNSRHISEMSVWEIQSSSFCVRRYMACFPAPILDGVLDDDGNVIRLAITVMSCCPSIRILHLVQQENGEVELIQHSEIVDAARVLYFKDGIIFFAYSHGSDDWPMMMNLENDGRAQLTYPGGGAGEPDPHALEYCSGLHVWRSNIVLFTYSGLHIFKLPKLNTSGVTEITPTISKSLSEPIFKVTFLDACSVESETVKVRWVVQLENTYISHLVLHCKNKEFLDLCSDIEVSLVCERDSNRFSSKLCFPVDYAIGNTGAQIILISAYHYDPDETPIYEIEAVQEQKQRGRSSKKHIVIPEEDLPFSRSVSCLDFDDGHGLLLIGSDAMKFCLVSFAGSLLPDEAVEGKLPVINRMYGKQLPKTRVPLDIPAYYLYRLETEVKREKCPAIVVEDANRLWGDAFAGRPPIRGWSNDWSSFTLVKEWIQPLSLWSAHDRWTAANNVAFRIRNRLGTVGKIIPIMYNITHHNFTVIRIGNRVLLCASLVPSGEYQYDESAYRDLLIVLPLTYTEFISADSDIVTRHIVNGLHELEGHEDNSLTKRLIHASVDSKGYSARDVAAGEIFEYH